MKRMRRNHAPDFKAKTASVARKNRSPGWMRWWKTTGSLGSILKAVIGNINPVIRGHVNYFRLRSVSDGNQISLRETRYTHKDIYQEVSTIRHLQRGLKGLL